MSKSKATPVAVQLLHAVTVLQAGKEKALEAGGHVTLPDDVAAELVAAGAARYTQAAAPAAKPDGQGDLTQSQGQTLASGDLLQQVNGGTGS